MPPALIPLIIEYSLKYGIPAVTQLIQVISKPSMTWEEIQAAFAVAETPYGLTPQLTEPLTDLGVIAAHSPSVSATGAPDGFPMANVIVSLKRDPGSPAVTLCNAAGNCWFVPDESKIVKASQLWTVGAVQFWMVAGLS